MIDNVKLFFENVILDATGSVENVLSYQSVSGGCINNTQFVQTNSNHYFIKWFQGEVTDLYAKESKGLGLLKKLSHFTIPKVYGTGMINGKSYLLLEYIKSVNRKADYWQDLAVKLAAMHRNTNELFGLNFDNYIGKLPQYNDFHDNWSEFFISKRLEVQLDLALVNKYIDEVFYKKFISIYPKLKDLFSEEAPGLVHGDLWSGNVMVDDVGKPCIIDPAVYFANREVEIAFSMLFGGFDNEFYNVYNEIFPLQPGFEDRIELYNLYPLLVHVNLFGVSYLQGIRDTLNRFC